MTELPKSPSAWGMLLHKFWRQAGMPLPVDVGMLAMEYTRKNSDPIAKVSGHDMPGIDGMLYQRKRGDWCILFDENVPVSGRVNFTLGHELGHYVLHRREQSEFKCAQGEILDYTGKASRAREAEANKFSAYLLMPMDDFRQQVSDGGISLELLGHCAQRYNVSLTAAALKWLEFTPEAAMLVAVRDEFVLWSYVSQSARKLGAYLKPGTEAHPDVVARINTRGSSEAMTPVAPGVWHRSLAAEEAAIVSDKYDLALFLVRLHHDGEAYADEEQSDAYDVLLARATGQRWS